ncbi:MAG: cyclic nucleotide-binding domain-containing protein, partial [Spirulina sp.]
GQRGKAIETDTYDPRLRPWYKFATGSQNRDSTWSPVYTFFTATAPTLGITAAKPLYSQDNRLLGVLGVDLYLSEIATFLQQLQLSPRGVSFMMERDGLLIASSTQQLTQQEINGRIERINIFKSEDARLREVAIALLDKFNHDLSQIKTAKQMTLVMDGKRYFVGVTPLDDARGIDWLLVVSIPELDFQDLIVMTTRWATLIGVITLVIGTGMGLLAARWIVKPIDLLNVAALDIEAERFEPQTLNSITSRPDEVGKLARIFQNMGRVISSNQTSLKEQMQDLETQMAAAKRQQTREKRYDTGAIQALLARSRQTRSRMNATVEPEVNTASLESFLAAIPLLTDFSGEEIGGLIAIGRQKTLPGQTRITRAGEISETLSLILAGCVEAERSHFDRPSLTLSPGDAFDPWSFLLGIPSPSTLRTLEPTQLFAIERQGLKKYLEAQPQLIEKILRQLVENREELLARRTALVPIGTIEDEDDFDNNFNHWVRDRLIAQFDLSREKI